MLDEEIDGGGFTSLDVNPLDIALLLNILEQLNKQYEKMNILTKAKRKAYEKDVKTVKEQATQYFGDNVEIVEAKSRKESSELMEVSLHERKVALNEALEEIEDKTSEEAINIKEEIDWVDHDLQNIEDLKKEPGQES